MVANYLNVRVKNYLFFKCSIKKIIIYCILYYKRTIIVILYCIIVLMYYCKKYIHIINHSIYILCYRYLYFNVLRALKMFSRVTLGTQLWIFDIPDMVQVYFRNSANLTRQMKGTWKHNIR